MTLQTWHRSKTLSWKKFCVCLWFFSVTLCFFSSFWCICAEHLSFSAVILHQSVAHLCLFALVFVLFCWFVSFWGLFTFLCVFLCLFGLSLYLSLICFFLSCLQASAVILRLFFWCLPLGVCHVSILCLFVFFVLILVNHLSLDVDLPVVSFYWFASFLTIFVSLILLQLVTGTAPCRCFYVNRLFNLPAQLVIR